MGKLSKTDGPQGPAPQPVLKESDHFKVGSFIKMPPHRRGEITAVLTCKCKLVEKGLRIAWDDGSVSVVQPFALNQNGLSH